MACSNQVQFNSSKSSTFIDGGMNATAAFATGVGVKPVESDKELVLTLHSGSDTVSIGNLKADNVSLFLITNQTPEFNEDTFSGILGENFLPLSSSIIKLIDHNNRDAQSGFKPF
jgi:hypothetical protein